METLPANMLKVTTRITMGNISQHYQLKHSHLKKVEDASQGELTKQRNVPGALCY